MLDENYDPKKSFKYLCVGGELDGKEIHFSKNPPNNFYHPYLLETQTNVHSQSIAEQHYQLIHFAEGESIYPVYIEQSITKPLQHLLSHYIKKETQNNG